MRVLLVQNTLYVPAFAGENKVNRILMEGLAARGHVCQVVAPAFGRQGCQAPGQLLAELQASGVELRESPPVGSYVFGRHGVEVHAVTDPARLRHHVIRRIHEFQPTHIVASAGDPGLILLETVLETACCPVVYLAHTPLYFPFGPVSLLATPDRKELFHRLAGIVAVSRYCRTYIEKWGGLKATLMYLPAYGVEPFPLWGAFDRGFVTLINPCAYKGISIFLMLARALPQVKFAAVPTWGTTAADGRALQSLPNVRILAARDSIDEIYSQTRILLVPSLWDEGFGIVCVEAMLRGIPVLASNAGGLPEAKLGVDYVLPVHPIEECRNTVDDQGLRVPVVPAQDLHPWQTVLLGLLSDRDHYEALSAASRREALKFASSLGIGPFEELLLGTVRPTRPANPRGTPSGDPTADPTILSGIQGLSRTKRELLLTRLRAKPNEPT